MCLQQYGITLSPPTPQIGGLKSKSFLKSPNLEDLGGFQGFCRQVMERSI
jgi:hypothetical protein